LGKKINRPENKTYLSGTAGEEKPERKAFFEGFECFPHLKRKKKKMRRKRREGEEATG